MLAYLLKDDKRPDCEPTSLDATLAASDVDQDVRAHAAYEAALRLESESWWVPTRLRHSTICERELPA
jgi:hypothetical protein